MNKRVVIIISLMTMTVTINNLAHPVTPELVSSIGHGSFLLGVLFAAMSFTNFIMSPIWGRLSDKIGRKPFMVIAPIFYGLSQLGFGFSTNPYIIIVFRMIAGGVACATFVAGMAYLIDVSDASKRTKIMALYTALTGFASTLGYLIGGVIGEDDYHRTFIFQCILSIFSSIIMLIFIKESHQKAKIVNKGGSIFKDLSKYRGTIVPFLLIITLLTSFMHIGFNNSFNSYMKFVLNLGPKKIGIIMAITGFIGIIMNIMIFPFIKRKFNDYFSLMLSAFMMFTTLAIAMYLEKHYFTLMIIILVIYFGFLALYKPLLQSILSKRGNASGEIMGLNNAFGALGNVGGSFYAGAVFTFSVDFTFYSLSAIGLLVFIMLVIKKNYFINEG